MFLKMLAITFAVVALTAYTCEVFAEPEPEPEPEPQGYVDYSTLKCPNFFPMCPYHYFCVCDFSYCLDPCIEQAAENLAAQTTSISLCDIQQMFIMIENLLPGIDYDTEIDIVSSIVLGLQSEIIGGDYVPTQPPGYCNNFSTFDPFSPMTAFSSVDAMYFYDAKICWFLSRSLPYLSNDFQETVYNSIAYNMPSQFQEYFDELYFKMTMCLRSILSNMIDVTPYYY